MVDEWPSHWEADVTTADGGTVRVRPITPGDAERLVAFHARQSPESIYFRYFSARPTLSAADVRRFTTVDHRDRMAFIALLDDLLIGVGRYDRYRGTDEAEVAFFIDDEHHGRGLATILLEYLASAARANGIKAFVATVLPSNRAMLSVFHQAGFETATRFADGVIEVRFELSPTPASVAAREQRAARADARTVARLLEPQTVAVIGAGRRRGTIGHEVLRQLLGHEFAGPVYPVNREATHVASVRAWPSILDVPDQVDLAIVAVPAGEVLDAVAECARARVGALVVVSLGFDDERAAALVALAHRYGIRVLGPGSFGAINTDPAVRLHATFAPVEPREGRVALSLQSGTLAAGIIRRATAQGLGFSSIVAVGEKLDVSGNDLLAWWESDPRTDVIAMSLESYGNPRRFRRIAPRVARSKPIVAMVRSGLADDDLLLQTGVVPVRSLDALLDAARVLAWQPVPGGPRVAVIADSAGSLEFAVGACAAAGLEVVRTVTVEPDAAPGEYEEAVAGAIGGADVDAALVLYAAGLDPRPEEVAAAVGRGAATAPDTPVVASFPGHDLGGVLPGSRIPELGFPEAAANALAAAVRYGTWCRRPVGEPPRFGTDLDLGAARAVVADALAAAGPLTEGPMPAVAGAYPAVGSPQYQGLRAVGWGSPSLRLRPEEAVAVLRAAGAQVVEQRVAATAAEAAEAAEAIGGTVALKAIGRPPWAKTELAGVALDLHGPEAVAASWARMAASLGDAMTGAVVQAMVVPGVDVQVGLDLAPVVGMAAGVGPGGAGPGGGVPAARAVLPLTDASAAELVARAMADAGRDAVADLLLRLSVLAEEVPQIHRLVLNPVIVSGGAAWVTDIELDVRPAADEHPDDVRRLG